MLYTYLDFITSCILLETVHVKNDSKLYFEEIFII